jgi:hypothetical protein
MSRELRDLAEALFQRHGGDPQRAAAELNARLAKDPDLRLAIVIDWLSAMIPTVKHSRRRPGPHRTPSKRRSTPTSDQKAAAVRAELKLTASIIFDRVLRGGRRLGDLRCNELMAFAEQSAATATGFLSRGYDDAVDAIGCKLLAHHVSEHVRITDPFAVVRDVVKPAVATKVFDQAKISAAEMIRDGSARLARELMDRGGAPPELAP